MFFPQPAFGSSNRQCDKKDRDMDCVADTCLCRLPKLDPGASLPKPPIKADGGVARIADRTALLPKTERVLANSAQPVVADASTNKKSKKVRNFLNIPFLFFSYLAYEDILSQRT
jgi:hypothetical protein